MGRKKAVVAARKEKSAAEADRDNWDCWSTASSSTTWTTCAEEFEKKDDTTDSFQSHLDQLFEQRYTTREKALSRILQVAGSPIVVQRCTCSAAHVCACRVMRTASAAGRILRLALASPAAKSRC